MKSTAGHSGIRFFVCAAATAAILALAGCASPEGNADTILMNGKVITVNNNFSIAEAVAIKGDRITAVGDSEDVMDLAGDSTKIIDLHGRAVIPGIIEGHAHPVGASKSEYFAPIPEVSTIRELLTWIAREAAEKEDGEWIIHPKFFVTRLRDMRQVTKHELDSVAPDNPVFLNGSYGGMVNTKALEMSGMDHLSHDGILRDRETGELSGVIRRSAFNLLAIDDEREMSHEEEVEALETLFHLYNAIGITSVTCGHGGPGDLTILRELKDKGDLTVRIFQNFLVPSEVNKGTIEDVRKAVKAFGCHTGDGDEWVRVGALKARIDGGVLTGTAFLRRPWGNNAESLYGITDPTYRGELMLSKEQLVRMITVACEEGWKFTAHVTGGGGVDTLLAAYEEVNKTTPIEEKRFSIIHGNFYTADAIKKMAGLGIYADMQPAWFLKDADLLEHVLGGETIALFHPYHSLFEAGIIVNGGSDHMVKLDPDKSINPYNPFLAMWSVVSRKTSSGKTFNPEEAITRKQALQMYTINNAYASFEEDLKGSIEVGKLADLVVLSDDILTCPEDTIKAITPLLTMVGGKAVFDSGVLR